MEDRLEKLISDIRETLKGIEDDHVDSDDGWWETSTGVEFGKRKLQEVIDLVTAAFNEK